ncbi:MAG: signal peptidase II, partial [Roseomonas sp.]|nr:signal peptidase II [Roseomonas sp.]
MFRLGLIFAAMIFVFDQLSKWFVLDVLLLPKVQHIPLFSAGPFGLDLTMVWNRGVTFGLFSGDGPWNHVILAGLALAIAVFLLRWLARAEGRMVALALGAVIGGAIG